MSFRSPWAIAPYLALFILGVAVFKQVVGFDFLIMEDDIYASAHPVLLADIPASDKLSYIATTDHYRQWHPVALFSHLVDIKLFKVDPAGHHLTSLLFHFATGFVLIALLTKLGLSRLLSFIAVGLFLIHPQRAQAVAWIAERKDLIAYFCAAVSLLLYTHFRAGSRGGRWLWAAAILTFAVGLSSRYIIASLPIGLLLIDRYLLATRDATVAPAPAAAWWKRGLDHLPFWVLGIGFFVLTAHLNQAGVERFGGSKLALWERSLFEWPVLAWQYFAGSFNTTHAPFYSGFGEDHPQWKIVTGLAILAVGSALAFVARRRCPLFALGWWWSLASLLPVAGFLVLGPNLYCDHYAYFPHFFLFAGLLAGISALMGSAQRQTIPRIAHLVASAAAIVLLGAFSLAGFRAASHYQDTETLMTYEAEINPAERNGHYWRVLALLKSPQDADSSPLLEDALRHARNSLGTDYPGLLGIVDRELQETSSPDATTALFYSVVNALAAEDTERFNTALATP